MDTPLELKSTLVIIALIPAIGEELMFRGVIQKYLSKENIHKGIWITAFLFSALHFQFEGGESRTGLNDLNAKLNYTNR